MSIEHYEVPPPGYVEIEDAADYVGRSLRTIYYWIEHDGVRTFSRSQGRSLVHLRDVVRVEAERAKGRRRKPRPPRILT